MGFTGNDRLVKAKSYHQKNDRKVSNNKKRTESG